MQPCSNGSSRLSLSWNARRKEQSRTSGIDPEAGGRLYGFQLRQPKLRGAIQVMHSGRVFRFDFPLEGLSVAGQDVLWDANGTPRRTELFWLFENCAKMMTLVKGASGQVAVERIRPAATSSN